jgi:hypothetical protein
MAPAFDNAAITLWSLDIGTWTTDKRAELRECQQYAVLNRIN